MFSCNNKQAFIGIIIIIIIVISGQLYKYAIYKSWRNFTSVSAARNDLFIYKNKLLAFKTAC